MRNLRALHLQPLMRFYIFLLAEPLKTLLLILKKTHKSHQTNPISAMLMTKEAGRGGEVQISPEERHCLAGDVLPLAAVYSHPCCLGSSS